MRLTRQNVLLVTFGSSLFQWNYKNMIVLNWNVFWDFFPSLATNTRSHQWQLAFFLPLIFTLEPNEIVRREKSHNGFVFGKFVFWTRTLRLPSEGSLYTWTKFGTPSVCSLKFWSTTCDSLAIRLQDHDQKESNLCQGQCRGLTWTLSSRAFIVFYIKQPAFHSMPQFKAKIWILSIYIYIDMYIRV